MLTELPACAMAALLAVMMPVDPGIHPDDFISVTCFEGEKCLILDRAGNLFFSPDAGKTLKRRASHPRTKLVKIRFAGLLDGSGTDSRGGLWRSRDGGRSFELAAPAKPRPPGTGVLRLANERTARLSSAGALQISADGGKTWMTASEGGWLDASVTRQGVLLAGPSGSLALAIPEAKASIEVRALHRARPAVTDVEVLDRRHIWAVFADGSLKGSHDGGDHWFSPGRIEPGGEPRISFIDPRRGFAVSGSHTVLASADGGQSWKRLGHWPDIRLTDVCFVDPRRGFVVGEGGSVLRTTDGGSHWTLDRLPVAHRLQRVLFTDARNGWLIGSEQAVYRTRDGGRSWTRMLSGNGTLRGLSLDRSGRGWVAGDGGVALFTTNGGESWTPHPTGAQQTLHDVCFIDRLRGIAVGEAGTAMLTKDGGHSWARLELRSLRNLTVIACQPRTQRCLLGGEGGLLLWGNPFRFFP